MGDRLAHRGPDDEQLALAGPLALIFRRLSIVDVEGGRQPIWNENGSLLLAVNGEIYNHRELRARLKQNHVFRTESDCEIVLHLYEELGEEAFGLLNGMFAIAIWDRGNETLTLARDRLGIKPLYYARSERSFIFASELKGLVAHPEASRRMCWADVGVLLREELFRAHAKLPTFMEDVEHVRGGTSVTCTTEGVVRHRAYWRVQDFLDGAEANREHDTDAIVEQYAELLEDSITKRLMADVGVGAFLSGGLDSAVITAVASKGSPAGFPSFHIREPSVERTGDTEAARELASFLGLSHHEVPFSGATLDRIDFSLSTLEYLVWMLDAPLVTAEVFLKRMLHHYAKQKYPDLKVMLLGQGADEFAGGYSRPAGADTPAWNDYLDRLATRHFPIPEMYAEVLTPGTGVRDWLFDREAEQRVDTLQMYNLWHEDRTSSAQSVEARVPFLDHRLVEFLVALPRSLREELFWDKEIIRRAAENHLPGKLARRPKVGLVGGEWSTMQELRKRMVLRAYPDFRAKYLDTPRALFAPEPLQRAYKRLRGAKRMKGEQWPLLVGLQTAMTTSIFERVFSDPEGCGISFEPA